MKKVLIITYYWPPAGGPGVQRWLKFATYLRQFDIEPVLYIPENPTYPILDKSLIHEIPEDITILKHPIFEPYKLAKIFSKKETETISSGIITEKKKQNLLQKLMLYVRGNFFIPDARKFWVKPSVKYLSSFLEKHRVDAIITTGPPHSLHLIGLAIKSKTNLPWLADFRDPWTTISYHDKLKLTKNSQKRHKKLEKRVIYRADHIITTSPKTKTDFEKITNTKISCITNGFDKVGDLYIHPEPSFTIAHIGSLLEKRNPKILWETLGELTLEYPEFSKHLRINLAGKVSKQVIYTITENGLEKHLQLSGYVAHEQALSLQRKAQLLLLIEINSEETKAIIPGKVFEYLAARRPILAIGPEEADFFNIIRSNAAGKCFNYSEKLALKKQILFWFEQYKRNGLPDTNTDISAYSRKKLTKNLAELIENLLEEAR